MTFLSSVQTKRCRHYKPVTVWFEAHTHTLMHSVHHVFTVLLYSRHVFASDFLELCSYEIDPGLRGAPCRAELSFSALQTDETHVGNPLLAFHTSSRGPFRISIWNLVILHRFKKSPLTIIGTNLSTVEKTQTKEKETNDRYLWPRCRLNSLGCSSVHLHPHQTHVSLVPSGCDLWSLLLVENPLRSLVHILWSLHCPLFDKTPDLRFSSTCDGFARRGTCYRLSAASPPNALWDLYSSTDTESSPEKDKSWSSGISRGSTSFSSPSPPKMVCLQENRTRSVSATLQQLHKDASTLLEPQKVPSDLWLAVLLPAWGCHLKKVLQWQN